MTKLILTAAAFLTLSLTPAVAHAQVVDRPNIVVIVTDDQREDTMTSRFMPNVASLLSDGSRATTFTNGYVSNSLCCPSRASILTGAYSHTTGVFGIEPPHGGFTTFDDEVSIATVLDPDYQTMLVGKYLNGAPEGGHFTYVPPGWDRWFSMPTGSYYNYFAANNGRKTAMFRHRAADYSGRVLARRAIRYVESATEPFFLYYAPIAPHAATEASRPDPKSNAPLPDPRDIDRFVGVAKHRPASYGIGDDVSDMPFYVRRRAAQVWGPAVRRKTDMFRQRQLETIYGMDREIGRLVSSLPENTLILFISDNGYLWGEHTWTTKIVPYEESISVPFFVRWPPGTNPANVDPDRLALNVDIVPTILDIAGYPANTPTASAHYALGDEPVPPDGVSLFDGPHRTQFPLEHWDGTDNPSSVPGYCGLRTDDGWMYVRYWDRAFPDNGFEELYNVISDPLQQTNLVANPGFDDIQLQLKQATRDECSPAPPTYSWKG